MKIQEATRPIERNFQLTLSEKELTNLWVIFGDSSKFFDMYDEINTFCLANGIRKP